MKDKPVYLKSIQILFDRGWKKYKENEFYIILEKDDIEKKISLSTGNVVKEQKRKDLYKGPN